MRKVLWAIPEYNVPILEEYKASHEAKEAEYNGIKAIANNKKLLRERLFSRWFVSNNDGLAIISIRGPLYEFDYLLLAYCIEYAEDDPETEKILLVINSPGGQVEGLMEFVSLVSKVKKSVYAYIEGYGTSAAYAIASAADTILASPASEIGSIGIRAEYYDYTEMYKNAGIRIFSFRSKHSTKKALPPDSEEGKKEIEKDLEDIYDIFAQSIADGRGITKEDLIEKASDGLVFRAKEAKEKGLIDEIVADIDACVELIKSEEDEGESMADNITTLEALTAAYPALVASAIENGRIAGVEEGKKAESGRVKGILALSEYTDNMEVLSKAIEDGKTASDAQMEILKAQKSKKEASEKDNKDVLDALVNASTQNNAVPAQPPVEGDKSAADKGVEDADKILAAQFGEGEKK